MCLVLYCRTAVPTNSLRLLTAWDGCITLLPFPVCGHSPPCPHTIYAQSTTYVFPEQPVAMFQIAYNTTESY